MKLGTWLLAMMEPLLGRILASLGFSVVSIVGMNTIFSYLKNQVVVNIGGLQPQIVDLFLYAGGGVGISIILGALSTKMMLWQITSSTKILGSNPG